MTKIKELRKSRNTPYFKLLLSVGISILVLIVLILSGWSLYRLQIEARNIESIYCKDASHLKSPTGLTMVVEGDLICVHTVRQMREANADQTNRQYVTATVSSIILAASIYLVHHYYRPKRMKKGSKTRLIKKG